jgi:hypothetical protein
MQQHILNILKNFGKNTFPNFKTINSLKCKNYIEKIMNKFNKIYNLLMENLTK